jgi:hypothetical protein
VSSVWGSAPLHASPPSLVCRPLAPSANGISLVGTVQVSKWDTVLRGPERHRRLAGRIEVWPVQTTLRSRERKVWGNGKLAPGKTALASPGLHFHLCVPFLDETAGTDRGGEHLAKASANVDTKGRRTGRGIAKRLLRVMLPAGHLRLTRDSDPEWLRECASEPLVRRSGVGVGTQPAVSRVAGPRGCRATSRQHVFTTGPSHVHPHREPSGLQATTQGC